MNIPKLASDNHQFVLIIFLLLTFMGVHAFFTMPRTEDPPLTLPGASIFIVLPGSSPADLEELVADPLEEAVNELEDIKRIETVIKEGIVSISVEFIFGTDAADKYGEVVQQVNALRSSLPEEIYSITVSKWSSSDVNILQLAFVSDSAEYSVLEDQAEQLKQEIEQIAGVKSVDICGLPDREIRVSLDFSKMSMMNISLDQIANAIISNNLNIPGGRVRSGDVSFTVRTSGSYETLGEIRKTVVGSYQGRLIHLEDVAVVGYDYKDATWIARFNGQRAIFLTVKQKEEVNVFDIAGLIHQAVDSSEKNTSEGVQLMTVFDQSVSVKERINGFLLNLMQGMIIVGILIFLSLGFRVSLIVILAVPLSIVTGLGLVDLAGFGLQQISIAALVIALGMLVDNSIVITENIERFIRQGFEPERASIEATNQLSLAVLSATLTTQLAFLPIIMMPDRSGKFVQSLPVTVILTLFASLLIALFLTPYLGGRFLKPPSRKERSLPIRKFLNTVIEGPYSRILRNALNKPWRTIFITFMAFCLSLGLIAVIGVSFFPKAEKNQFLIRITVPEQSDIRRTDAAARTVEQILDTIPLVKRYATNVGHGNPRIYYNLVPVQEQKNFAEIYVELEYFKAKEFDGLITRLRDKFSTFTFARVEIKELEQGSPIEAPVVIKITGENTAALIDIARQAEEELRKVPGIINTDNQIEKISTDLKLVINKDKAGMLGVPLSDIDRTVRACVAGLPVSEFHGPEGQNYDIVLRMQKGDSIAVENLSGLYVKSLENRFIPLSQLAEISFEPSSGIIMHYNLMRCATITADIRKGYFLDDVIGGITPWLKTYPWPAGYGYFFAGEIESRQESFGGMTRALIIAALLIFAILVLQFRSVKQPLIIFSSIPLAITGAAVALFITGNSFSFTAFIGAISLIGIVVNNSIILVDYTNQLIRGGSSIREALTEAGMTRFTPIILTAVTTIGGLLPLTIGGGTLWAPMGWTIIGGLLFSTILTLVVVPVLYQLIQKKN
ncbi:MAG: efflux RND transporter permease subunit [Bacteroidales bacterium]|nr:efflux RND transporter permease subunit [Bacteroidales bacterium]